MYSSKTIEEVLKKFETTKDGLSNFEATNRLRKYGLNELKEGKKDTKLKIFFRQFKSALVAILIVAAIVSAAVGFYNKDPEGIIDTSVIVLIILLNSVLGFVQEYRAEKAMEALKKMSAPKATIIRNNLRGRISSRSLVPGDIVVLAAGDRIPADIRLIESANLTVDESALTGESVPVHKDTHILSRDVTSIAELSNIVFMNTTIATGRAIGVVVETGMRTQIGSIAKMIQKAPEKETPLQKKLREIGKFLGIATLIVCTLVFGVEMLRGGALIPVFMIAVSLAVAAVPEGLPAVVTITLAMGLQKMARRNAIVKRLPAVETLGSTNVICTDKTGTLTKNQMTVREAYLNGKTVEITGTGYNPTGKIKLLGKTTKKEQEHLKLFLKTGALCNDSYLQEVKGKWEMHGDPTEGCLLTLAVKGGFDLSKLNKEYLRMHEFEFNSIRKRMTTIHQHKDKLVAFSKGAPEIILSRCSVYYDEGKKKRLTKKKKDEILKNINDMAGRALRVLAFAYKELPKKSKFKADEIENKLTFVGLVGMIDPPREEVKEALETCKTAGIRTIMVTGDHHETAVAIGKEIGLFKEGDLAIDGEELSRMSEKKLNKIIEKVSIFSRVSPEHKVRILKALQRRGHIVAMTGDGVNDAPALKNSDIGVSMSITGTDVAKGAADMVLEDDNFATIVHAIEEGRSIYDNIRKFLHFLLMSNGAEVLIIFIAALIGMPLPLLAVQILWVNLLTDGLPAVALALDPPAIGIMNRNPRKSKENTISKSMIQSILFASVLMCIATLGLFKWVLYTGMPEAQARTVALAALIVLEMVSVQIVRGRYNVKWNSNKWVWLAILLSLGLMIAIIYLPVLQTLFHTVALPLSIWPWILGVSAIVYIVIIIKQIIERRFAK